MIAIMNMILLAPLEHPCALGLGPKKVKINHAEARYCGRDQEIVRDRPHDDRTLSHTAHRRDQAHYINEAFVFWCRGGISRHKIMCGDSATPGKRRDIIFLQWCMMDKAGVRNRRSANVSAAVQRGIGRAATDGVGPLLKEEDPLNDLKLKVIQHFMIRCSILAK